jgi:hypothetical protein
MCWAEDRFLDCHSFSFVPVLPGDRQEAARLQWRCILRLQSRYAALLSHSATALNSPVAVRLYSGFARNNRPRTPHSLYAARFFELLASLGES